MVELAQDVVENEIIKVVEELNDKLSIGANINAGCSPGGIGIGSQILVTIMSRLEHALGITIPSNTYIFYDKKTHKQLSITEAAKKLIKVATNGK